MNRFSPYLVAVTIFVLVLCVGTWLLVVPSYASYSQDEHTIASTSVAPPVVKKTPPASQQEQFTSSQEEADTLLPTTDDQYDLSVQVQALCQEIGVTITTLSFTTPDLLPKTTPITPATFPALDLVLGVAGSYAQVQQVTTGLTALNRFIQITGLTLSTVSAGSTTPGQSSNNAATGVQGQIDASAYYLPASTTPTPTPTP